jgi:hypothetical protein
MRKGDIVRQVMFDRGGLIGPYMRIEYIERDRVYCSVLNSDTPNKLVLGNRLKKIPSAALQVSEDALKWIKEHIFDDQSISHSATKTWLHVHETTPAPSIIKLYTNKGNYYYVKLFSSKIRKSTQEIVVEIEHL